MADSEEGEGMNPSYHAIDICEAGFAYGHCRRRHEVLKGVSCSIDGGEVVSLLGANGAGKSTLFKCILGLLDGYSGSILIQGHEASQMTAKELSDCIAYIPQLHYPAFNYSVLDMVLMGTGHQFSIMSAPGAAEMARSREALSKIGISHLADRDFSSLSGGEQQLVLMARALVQQAPIWILDEPVASLDFGNQIMVQEQLRTLSREGYAILMSTHNPEQAYMFSDKIVALDEGRVLSCGKPSEVINEELIRSLYGIDVKIDRLYEDSRIVCTPISIRTYMNFTK